MSELLDTVFTRFVARCDLLGLEPLPLVLLGVDVAVLLMLAGGLVGRLERSGEGSAAEPWDPARALLAHSLVLLAAVVASATLLGATRNLNSRNLLASHVLALALFVLAEWSRGRRIGALALGRWLLRPLAAGVAPLRGLFSRAAWRGARGGESLLLVGIAGVLGFYLVLALFTPPLNYDSNTYRLSRIALWLQEGSIYHFPTNDERQNWIGQNSELVMLWLTGFFRREYPLVKLAQYGGGVLCCLSIYQLASWLGMARFWRFGAALVLLGIPTVGTQFISSQTDLFTAGCLAAGLAFLPAALRGPRRVEWLFVGAGCGLALGAKATVLYWAPGLGALLVGWAWLDRASPRAVLRGGALAATVALPLCGFNFLLNSLEFESPVAPVNHLRSQGSVEQARPVVHLTSNLLALAWQLFEPHSNPFLPAVVQQAGFDELLARAASRGGDFLRLQDSVSAQGGWRLRGLNEDEASFGALAVLFAALGGLAAGASALRRRAADRGRVALLGVALAGFVLTYSWMSVVGLNHHRYFCVQAPFTALVAADLFARRRGLIGRAFGRLFLVMQFATAVYVGVESGNQGLRVLRDPASAGWHANWAEARRLVEALGESALQIGLALPGDSWQAPLFRSGVPHRWQLLEGPELSDRPSLDELMARRRLDVLVADPVMLRRVAVVDVSALPLSSSLGMGRAIYRRANGAAPAGPRVLIAYGVHSDRWTGPQVAFRILKWSVGRFEVAVSNPTPLRREIKMRSRRQGVIHHLAPGEAARLGIDVEAQDRVELRIRPSFVPAAHGISSDLRDLGLLLDPVNQVRSEGVFADRWTALQASFQLVDWHLGTFELELGNPTSIPRTVRARSSLQEASWEISPQSERGIALAVEPQDRVVLEVTPPFVPAATGASSDARELGLLLLPPKTN